MARNKHNTALFEVIRNAQKAETAPPARPAGGWFGKRAEENTPTPESSPAHEAGHTPETTQSAEHPFVREPGILVDTGRKEFVFRLSYTGAAVCSFGIMVGLVGAFVLGQRSSRSSVPVLAAMTTDELKNLPPQPEVLEISKPAPIVQVPPQASPQPTVETNKQNQTWNEPKPPVTLVVQDIRRTIGLNYLLIQSYPREEESMANAARELLARYGIECTVEQGLPGWKQDWFCVVGTTGFDKIRSSPVFDAYLQSILQVSAKFAGTAKFKKFEPLAYKWRGARTN